MSDIKGTNLAAPVVPYTSEDSYPTHYALYGHGGMRSVKTMAERDSIPAERREEGMLVYVIEDPSEVHTYQLVNGSWATSKLGAGLEAIKIGEASDIL